MTALGAGVASRFRARAPAVHSAEAGVVYVEFLMAFFPVFLLFLGVVQLAFIGGARIVVQHAAVVAARAAIVVLEDDPACYEGEPRGRIDRDGKPPSGASWSTKVASRLSRGQGSRRSSSGNARSIPPKGGPRLADIRRAAYMPLATIAPSPDAIAGWLMSSIPFSNATPSVSDAIGSSPVERLLGGMLAYGRAAAAVTFPTAPGAKEIYDGSVTADDVTVRVTFLYRCAIPGVDRLICDSLKHWTKVKKKSKSLSSRGRRPQKAPTERDQIARELRHVEAPKFLERLRLLGGRYIALRAEATLPNQKASYYTGARKNAGGAGSEKSGGCRAARR